MNRLYLILALVLPLVACAENTLQPPRITAVSHDAEGPSGQSGFQAFFARVDSALRPRVISRAEQQELGDALTRVMLQRVRLSNDPRRLARLEAIMNRLRKADDSGFRWRVYLVEDPRPNAFTTGGGHLFVTTGMMDVLKDDGHLATVLAHEMAHNRLAHVVLAQEKRRMAHDAHRFSREVLEKKLRMAWLGKSLSFIVNTSLNTYSRLQEDEADAEGMDLLVRAGFRPQVVLETFDRMKQVYRDRSDWSNFFYGNHPSYRNRRWHIENLIRAHYRAQAGLPLPRPRNFGPRRALAKGAEARSSSAREPAEAAQGNL
jgi:predicted Zn-dependent protease